MGAILHGDCIELMRTMPAASVDAIVTDPPYGLGFMGKSWDTLPPGEEWARECLRVLKPGGHLLAFGGTRTWHRLAVAVEDAGFELRDSIAWLYGSGFPKSLDVSKAIDKAAGAKREVVGISPFANRGRVPSGLQVDVGRSEDSVITAPATPDAERWQGWGTALKPAFEPIVVARKPLTGTVAANVLEHGTGALNIDACRVESNGEALIRAVAGGGSLRFHGFSTLAELEAAAAVGGTTPAGRDAAATLARFRKFESVERTEPAGRWPTNVVLDGHAADALDQQSGYQRDGVAVRRNVGKSGGNFPFGAANPDMREDVSFGGGGGASRFFPTFRYQAKAPARERPKVDGVAHPTVKPLELMRWLIRLVTPPGGVVLDPFAGSGTTVEAAMMEGFDCIAIEREASYLPLIRARVLARIGRTPEGNGDDAGWQPTPTSADTATPTNKPAKPTPSSSPPSAHSHAHDADTPSHTGNPGT